MRLRPSLIALPLALLAASTPAPEAHAFCGFYVGGAGQKLFNNATLVVLMRDGTRTVLSMQNNYQGPPERFALVVPVPVVLQKENVKTLPREVFDRVDQLAAPRLVEYWEQDPCAPIPPRTAMPTPATMLKRSGPQGRSAEDLGVTIEAQFTVGEYEIVILSAKDSMGLDTWLRQNKYAIPEGAEEALKPYVAQGMKFFVAKVDITKVKMNEGMAMLSPLRFHYDTETFSLPVRLGLLNSGGTQDLIVHILARQRYEVANRKNVTIPTNLDVDEKARDEFPAMYAALFDLTQETNPGAAITEYAWQATSCDPCPGPPLGNNDFATLGGDAIPSLQTTDDLPTPAPASVPGTGPRPGVGRGRWVGSPAAQFTLTRLHLRYKREGLADDLVFKAASPITGGREVWKTPGKLEHGSEPGGMNNFQGRYAIRHPWKGPVACAEPKRGIWGGPPAGDQAPPKVKPARDLAFAPRGGVQLASLVRENVPEIGLLSKAVIQPIAPIPTSSAAPAPSGAAAPAPSGAPSPASGGCACSIEGEARAPRGWLLGLALLLLGRRRRR